MRSDKTYSKIHSLALSSGLSSHDVEFIYAAYEEAQKATFGKFPIGCVIVNGNSIIGRGHNSSKSDPVQQRYNLKYRNFFTGAYSNHEHALHAELSAIKSIPYSLLKSVNFNKCVAYVYRIAPGLPHKQGLSAPCYACAHALSDVGIKKVVFSTDYGFGSSRLDF